MTDLTTMTIDALERLAYDAASRAAHRIREGIIESLADAIEAGAVVDADDLTDRLHEECDGAVVYTCTAAVYLLASDNADAADREGVPVENESQRAYLALRADLDESSGYADLLGRVNELGDDEGEG